MTAGASPIAPSGLAVATYEPDLWCTYAAVRTLAWLGRIDACPQIDETLAYLDSRQNSDGGYAWSRGMASDGWATFYCTQAMADLGARAPRLDRMATWLRSTWSDDAYAMMPDQSPDVWATHFSTRTVLKFCGDDVPDRIRLLAWLRALQAPDGGLSWSPDHSQDSRSDVRACFYGVMTWDALRVAEPSLAPPWDVAALVKWLRGQQSSEGGFQFSPSADTPCMWATYRATAALTVLGAAPPDRDGCVNWIEGLTVPSGAFVRWGTYDVADIWASFCAIGSLRALQADPRRHLGPVVARISELSCPSGGFTYREPSNAGDALSTAAAALCADRDDWRQAGWRRWLEGCRLPNEGGVMYMPARGSEVRCTLWALAAGACRNDPVARQDIVHWLRELQNPDGGFGYWEGRASEMVSTSAAVEILRLLDIPVRDALDAGWLASFVSDCAVGGRPAGYGHVPGGRPTLRAGLQALRVLGSLDQNAPIKVTELLDRHRVPSGGFANEGARMPDLLSSYEAVATADRYSVDLDTKRQRVFLDSIRTPKGTAWTPLAPTGGGPLADCLGSLLLRRISGSLMTLPALTLS